MSNLKANLLVALALCALIPVTNLYGSEYITESWAHVGEQIHRSAVTGYQLSYHLLRVEEGPIKNPEATHHLMLFIMAPNGAMVSEAEVRVRVDGANGAGRWAKARLMTGGFGVDLSLPVSTTYAVHAEVWVGNEELQDAFMFRLD
jgi:hypothetical protein